ncbi:hypothetical protein [Burkholderia mayonis]|uniref:hypothetical protein n=1 Tax=Burkholderia mayonis TaxID=1385591 RepID=UPI001CF7BBD7|nr:hypothetical protein [Burkholderia mayonis]
MSNRLMRELTEHLGRLIDPDVIDAGHYQHAGTCLYSMSPDGKLVIGRIPMELGGKSHHARAAICVMESGRAFKYAPLFGRVLVELAVDGHSRYQSDLEIFSPARDGLFDSLNRQSDARLAAPAWKIGFLAGRRLGARGRSARRNPSAHRIESEYEEKHVVAARSGTALSHGTRRHPNARLAPRRRHGRVLGVQLARPPPAQHSVAASIDLPVGRRPATYFDMDFFVYHHRDEVPPDTHVSSNTSCSSSSINRTPRRTTRQPSTTPPATRRWKARSTPMSA